MPIYFAVDTVRGSCQRLDLDAVDGVRVEWCKFIIGTTDGL